MSNTPDAATVVDAPTNEKRDSVVAPSHEGADKELRTQSRTSSAVEQGEKPVVQDESRFVTGKKLAVIHTAFMLSILLVALDQTIVATALPKIVSQFNALSQVTWVASGYFLTNAGLILPFGQFLTIAKPKWVFLVAITIFEIGSLLCGVAPNMDVLILGRAIAGTGAAGIFVSVLSIIAQITKLEQRPLLFGTFGAVFALASVVGPLLGGAFTQYATWRWCFYINLPVGAIAVAFTIFFLPNTAQPAGGAIQGTALQRWLRVDWIGSILELGMTTSLLLPLQWGGNTKPWTSPAVWSLFIVFAVLLVSFIAWEYRLGPRAIMPLSMFKRRTQVGAAAEAFFLFLGILVGTYYLPLFYQATRGASATKSGIDILPFMLSVVFASLVSGVTNSITGRYWPWLLLSPLLFVVGGGLLYTITEFTPNARIIGYQILFGFGIGGALQVPVIAIQADYADDERMIPQATSLVNFLQLLGGVLGIAIAGTIFSNELRANLPANLPADVAQQVAASVTIIDTLPAEIKAGVIHAYVAALKYIFLLGIPAGILASLSSLGIKNYNLKERGHAAMGGAA